MGRLDGKVALISGGARGMGNAEARLFAREGARVVIGDVAAADGAALAADIGDAARFVNLDVTAYDQWESAVAETLAAFDRLDILVNNAGIVIPPSPMRDLSLQDYRKVIDVNQTGVFLGMKAATPAMERSGAGSIINISSIAGMIGMDLNFSYVASKFAIRGMTRVAALELAPIGIRVNSVHPGFVHTRLGNPDDIPEIRELLDGYSRRRVPLGRTGEPEDIANLVLFLASDEAGYITGSEFVADGGILAGELLPRGPE